MQNLNGHQRRLISVGTFFLFCTKLLVVFLLLYLRFFTFAGMVLAQVVINEVHPNPSTGNDWVELKNLSASAVALSGWTLEDSSSAMTTTPGFTTQILPSGGYGVFDVGTRLNNGGDQVKLKNPLGSIIDQMSYASSILDQSWARQPDGSGNFVLSAKTPSQSNDPLVSPIPSPTATPTPAPSGEASPSPTPTAQPSPSPSASPTQLPTATLLPSPSPLPSSTPISATLPSPSPFLPEALQLSEIMACPNTGDTEWIEVFNPNLEPYSLKNWKIKDAVGNVRLVDTAVPAQDYGVLTLSSEILNNSGDSVTLETPDGQQMFTALFEGCTKGQSFVYFDGKWLTTDLVTKGGANILSNPDYVVAADAIGGSTPVITENVVTPTQSSPASPVASPTSSSSGSTYTKKKTKKAVSSAASDFSPDSESNLSTTDASISGKILGLFAQTDPTVSSSESAKTLEQSHPGSQTPNAPATSSSMIPFPLAVGLGVAGVACLSVGGFGLYRWYTEVHGKDLEMC
jgi:hypothetical protein